MNTTLVSVILPAWNAERHINACISSVLSQTHSALELIVINDGSSDTTAEILAKISGEDPRVKVIHLETNSGGPARPRNAGLDNALGEYFAFIDSDDVWHPEKLARQLAAVAKHQLNFVSTLHLRFTNDRALGTTTLRQHDSVDANSLQRMLKKNIVVTSSALVKASLIDKARFNETKQFFAVEDYFLWLTLHQKANIASGILQNKLVFYRLRPDSISASKLVMAKKIFTLLTHYEHNGKKLGLKKFYYFGTYILGALKSRYFYK